MAKLIHPKHSSGAVNAGEDRLLKYLEVNLPDNYFIVPNVEFANATPRGQVQYLEYDCLVIAPHAVYNIENKDWGGRLAGDDNSWYLNDSEKANPLKTVRFKTSVLASKFKQHNPAWATAWIASLLTLSNPRQNKSGLYGDCEKATYLLNDKLIEFLTNPLGVKKQTNDIADIYVEIKDFVAGILSEKINWERKEIEGYEIIETLVVDKCYSEYLCKPKGVATANKKRVKEYILDRTGLSPAEQERREKQIKNQEYALNQIKPCPFILNAQFRTSDDNRFYEITDYLDENSLRSELRRKTFTQEEKLNIIFNLIEALKVAHDANVFHRDLNPENIYLTNGYAALANFGKAYFVEHGEMGYTVAVTIDQCNATAYHAFELLAKDASRASDIYSLGVLIYELFTGKLPFNSPFELNNLGGKLPDKLLPTSVNPSLPVWLDELCRHTILLNDEDRWDNAQTVEKFLKEAISQSKTPEIKKIVPGAEELKPGIRLKEYTLYNELGKGGYSRVFKVKHTLMGEEYAMKIFNESINAQTVIDEYSALKNLNNPHIVKFIFNGMLDNGQFYTLMEYLDGENLKRYTKEEIKLPLPKVYQVAKDMLNALIYMQQQKPHPVIHRDIKPQNIVWDKNEDRFVLIDFNVATVVETNKDFVGTNPYLAPDLIKSSTQVYWDTSADTFALGITLYELACQNYPWTNQQPKVGVSPYHPQHFNPEISDVFAAFLLKAITCNKEDRFETASEMLAALEAVGEQNVLKEKEKPITDEVDFINQDFVDYLNSLYSQSRYGNAGTRAGHIPIAFDSLTYTKTKLDTKLMQDITAGKYRLVIITGNAGDGKTAFVKKIEEKAGVVTKLDNRNGAKFQINSIPFQSNYDGSQDEDDRANNEVLSDFFRPFENVKDFNAVNEGRIIAINEGRLVDFLKEVDRYKHLYSAIDDYFYKEGHSDLPPGLMVINLNLRSVTAKNGHESLFRQQIKALTQPMLWNNCTHCEHAATCFIKYNVDTITDSAAGDEIINRMEWLLRTVSYKRELHITMRDLRSFIAYLISRDCSCNDVPLLYQQYKEEPEKYWQYYYFNITSPAGTESNDRLIKLLRETDIAQVSIPSIDRDLYFGIHHAKDFLDFTKRGNDLLETFNDYKQWIPAHHQTDEIRNLLKSRHETYIRHQYFEGKFNFTKRLPYYSLKGFHKILTSGANSSKEIEDAKLALAKAISISEGCSNTDFAEGFLLLSSSRETDPLSKSYRRFSINEFELFVNKTAHLTEYIEYESDSLIFRHLSDKHVSLTVSLDLYEMLHFIKQGFSPSLNDLRGRFIELQIFKNLLENRTYNEVIVTKDNKDFFIISLDKANNNLLLSPLKKAEVWQ
ncbi:Serine/threonine-protein kinase pknE [Bacteroidales bacterium Barb6XT]|nr:Serine/threonine-protein kinase pknE [Bacteroidales bacterium Barb6XT]